jgi:hypothetical protein
METHDFRVIRAREFLAHAGTCSVGELPPSVLAREDTELRRLLGWVIDVVDDYANTDLDLDVSQVLLWGGVYLKPADVLSLCPGCLSRATDTSNTTPTAVQACSAPDGVIGVAGRGNTAIERGQRGARSSRTLATPFTATPRLRRLKG